MVRKADRPKHILNCAMDAAAAQGWASLTLRDISSAAEMSLANVHALYPTKHHILRAFIRAVDAAVLAGDDPANDDNDESPRDRLFDVLMRRFDALNEHRNAVLSIMDAHACDPFAALALAPRILCSMGVMLEAANISANGLSGAIRTKGLLAVWVATLRVWRKDDSADMAPTMAALDRNLKRAEALERRLPKSRRQKRAA
ncbi:MAG: TetR/AcrR family transcriptional regulator [Alphaproteobacteria bacterium]|nr:TetR/AcrR family transcriptional regulator [Alphaproteobacteria bacterium]